MVDQQGLEPRTNRLWAGCSNQLSYWSIWNWPPNHRRSIMAPPTGLEPVTSWLTVMRSTDWAMEDHKCWHLPIFPGRHHPSIFGTIELNFRVRHGNGWTLDVINTNYLRLSYYIISPILLQAIYQKIIIQFVYQSEIIQNKNTWILNRAACK